MAAAVAAAAVADGVSSAHELRLERLLSERQSLSSSCVAASASLVGDDAAYWRRLGRRSESLSESVSSAASSEKSGSSDSGSDAGGRGRCPAHTYCAI